MRKQETFVEKLYECNQHKEKLLISSQKLAVHIPFTLESYEKINAEAASFIDQMIFRFSKLQDTMGEKLFPAFLELIANE